ncbi:unnamed protein product, partial [Polarella glacialis]
DHPHIKGATVKGVEPLYEAIQKGTDKDWEERAGCMTFPDAVASVLKSKGVDTSRWLKESLKFSLPETSLQLVFFVVCCCCFCLLLNWLLFVGVDMKFSLPETSLQLTLLLFISVVLHFCLINLLTFSLPETSLQ